MHVKDFDGNGFAEQIVSSYNGGVSYPLPLRDDLIKTLPSLKARYLSYKDYARQTVADIFPSPSWQTRGEEGVHVRDVAGAEQRRRLVHARPLPHEAQIAPVYGILADDFDRDGALDLLLAGNFDGVKPEIGRMSASYGLLLRGDGKGAFAAGARAGERVLRSGAGARHPARAHGARRAHTRRPQQRSPLVFRAFAGGGCRPSRSASSSD